MKRISVLLSLPQLEALTALAKKLGLSFSETLRRAIDEYLKQQQS
jgi:predicted DNA-binding protein